MKECWINVYKYPLSGDIWQGGYMSSKEQADSYAVALNRLYRIHVRMK